MVSNGSSLISFHTLSSLLHRGQTKHHSRHSSSSTLPPTPTLKYSVFKAVLPNLPKTFSNPIPLPLPLSLNIKQHQRRPFLHLLQDHQRIGEIPSFKLIETDKMFAFLDIGPIAPGHALVIPKYHGAKLHDLPDEHLVELLPIVKKIAIAVGSENYNVLQNNGRIAHQQVDHVHFHMIPKPSESEESGLVVGLPTQKVDMAQLKVLLEEVEEKL